MRALMVCHHPREGITSHAEAGGERVDDEDIKVPVV